MLEFAENGKEISITLNVSGLIISGTMISERTYLEAFADGALKRNILKVKESGKLDAIEEEQEEEEDEELVEFIHLKDAKFFAPGLGSMDRACCGVAG